MLLFLACCNEWSLEPRLPARAAIFKDGRRVHLFVGRLSPTQPRRPSLKGLECNHLQRLLKMFVWVVVPRGPVIPIQQASDFQTHRRLASCACRISGAI